MKITKIIALICVFSLLTASLSSCGYEISIKKKGEKEETTAPLQIETTSAYVPVPTAAPYPEVIPTLPIISTDPRPDISLDTSFQPVALAPKEVIELYKRAVNDVKIRCPGYVRNEYQDISDVEADRGGEDYMNAILQQIGTELLKDSGDEQPSIQIMAHDDVAVRETFPMFDRETGCEFSDLSLVKTAECFADATSYKIIIIFDDIMNPEPYTSEFGKIMTPVDIDLLSGKINEYKNALNLNSYNFNINYTNCQIECTIDKASSRMTSLTQKMIMEAELYMNLDLILFQTKETKAEGTVVNRLEYYDFDWS